MTRIDFTTTDNDSFKNRNDLILNIVQYSLLV